MIVNSCAFEETTENPGTLYLVSSNDTIFQNYSIPFQLGYDIDRVNIQNICIPTGISPIALL